MKLVCRDLLPLLVLSLCALAGCLPPGDPPAGNIVENPKKEEENGALPFSRAREKALTEMIHAFLLFPAGTQVYAQGDDKTAGVIRMLAKESAAFSGVKVVAKPKPGVYHLSSEIRENRWQIRLLSPQGKALWTREYLLASLP